ncbi:type II secretion system F family protein [Brevundimonas sp. 2R-24]|uniref:Type II secretion system F family protein n=1 Tax=Peiella sedimenti TaxID=3061083 RepID=A0ABT8SKC4_9CAUL|nr:type II secretion system F family protein [Caulobacteraceae bacterium XZ-24]
MLPILAAVLAFVTIAAVGFALVPEGGSAERAVKRVQTMNARRGEQKAKAKPSAKEKHEDRRKQIVDQLKDADRKERKVRLSLASRLKQAGIGMSPRTFRIIWAVVGVTAGLLALLFSLPPLLALGIAFVLSLGLPRFVIGFLAKRRMKKFSGEFANAVDIIVRGIRSGLPVNDCLKIIARESPAPLGPEFQRLIENVAVGVPLDQALEKMYVRMPTPELRFFTIVIAIQQKTGGNLAEALANLSTVLRSRKLMAEKIKALSSEATASAGIIGSLPPAVMAMVMVTTPAYMMLMFTDVRGQVMLLGAVFWMSIGVFTMKRMISFKF